MAHLLGNFGHVFGNLDAGDGGTDFPELAAGGTPRFEIPDIDGGGTAAHPQNNYTLVLPAQLLRVRLDISHKLEAGQCQRGKTRNVFEEMSTIHPKFIAHVSSTFVGW